MNMCTVRRFRTVVGALVVGMIASACAADGTGSTLPEAPDVREVRSSVPVLPDDGLFRVTIAFPAAQAEAADSSSDASPVIGTIEVDEGSDQLTADELADLPPDSTLMMRDGVLGYVTNSGTFSPLSTDGASGVPIGPGVSTVEESVQYLESLPGVESVRTITDSSFAVTASSLDALEALDLAITDDAPLAFSTDPYEPYQWSLENDGASLSSVGLPQTPSQSPDADVDGTAAREGATGAGIVVAVVDSGVDFTHPDLAHARWSNPGEDCSGDLNGVDDDGNGFIDDCFGWDFGDEDASPFEGNNDEHGTHVAGIIAAKSNNDTGIAGIAPDAEIMDLKVSQSSGLISTSSIARAIRYATDNGADVVNLSLGTLPGATLESVSVLGDAVDYANSNGVLLVAAAGNSAVSLDSSPVYPASFESSNLLVVGASTSADARASFSNTGSDVDLFAPGDLILSTVPGNELVFMSGTSQAAPIAAATAALMLEANGASSPSALIDGMVRSGDQLEALDGLAANPIRLNTARAIGIEADIPGVGDLITIRGLNADSNGLVSASVTMGELGGQFNQPFHWEASLITLVDGEPYAVTEHPVTVHDVDGDELRSEQTDGRGAVRLAEKSSQSAEWSTTLPSGSYALLIEAVPRTDATARLGDGFLARFDIGGAAGDAEAVTDDDANSSGGGDSDAPDGSDADPAVDGGPASEEGSPGSPAIGDADSQGDTSNDEGEQAAGTADDGSTGETPDEPDPAETGPQDQTDASDDESADGTDAAGSDTTNDGGASNDETEEDGESDAGGTGDTSGSPSENDIDDESDVVELGPDEGQDGDWAISQITPRIGPVGVKNLVVIDGTFPEEAVVWFGDAPGEVVFGSESSLMVETPVRGEEATVDVSLRTREGEVLRVRQAYSFVAEGSDPVIVETDPVDDSNGSGQDLGDDSTGSSDDGAGGDEATVEEPTFDDEPADEVGVGAPPEDDTDEKDSKKSRNRQARANVIGEPRLLPNGLTGAPLSGLETIGGVPRCDEALCRTRRV